MSSRQNGKSDVKPIPSKPGVKITLSVRAIVQRLRRVLPKEQKLMRSRPTIVGDKRIYPRDVGRFYLINVNDETIVEHHIDLEAFGRRHRVVQAWEVLDRAAKQS